MRAFRPATISGSGFAPNSLVRITIESTPRTLASVTAGAQGRLSATVSIPANISAGTHTLKATGVTLDGATLVLSSSINVLGVGGANLARTGAQAVELMTVAGALLLLGAVALWVSRRRART